MSDLSKGDRIKILVGDEPFSNYRAGDEATVDYAIPSLDKIIVSVEGRKTACLYGFEEGIVWKRDREN